MHTAEKTGTIMAVLTGNYLKSKSKSPMPVPVPILKDVTSRVHYQGPVQLYARRLWPFLRMSRGYITKVLYNSTRDDCYGHS
jgi:Iap family predicted aminopeptidase